MFSRWYHLPNEGCEILIIWPILWVTIMWLNREDLVLPRVKRAYLAVIPSVDFCSPRNQELRIQITCSQLIIVNKWHRFSYNCLFQTREVHERMMVLIFQTIQMIGYYLMISLSSNVVIYPYAHMTLRTLFDCHLIIQISMLGS